jgi:hypothetical protein
VTNERRKEEMYFYMERDTCPQTVYLKTQSTLKYRDFDLEMDFVDTQLSIVTAKGIGALLVHKTRVFGTEPCLGYLPALQKRDFD